MILTREKYLEAVRGKRCLVLGDIILDRYISGEVNRISPEAPIPVVHKKGDRYVLGGAANVAAGIAGCGSETVLVGLIGEDKHGEELQELLKKNNIECFGVTDSQRMTTVKTRITGMNQQIIRLDQEETEDADEITESELIKSIMKQLEGCKVLVISDYAKGVCTEKVCKEVIGAAKNKGIVVIIDPKKSNWSRYSGSSLMTPNFKEYCEALSETIPNTEKAIADTAGKLIKKYDLNGILVTRSQYGMTYCGKDGETYTYATKAQEVFDVSGAGDTVVAGLASFISAGYDLRQSIEASNIAAAISVSKNGTYTVSADEIFDFIEEEDKGASTEYKIQDDERIVDTVQKLHEDDKKIVFTNGCFDILHRGHISYLQEARKLGDYLIVGLNSDRSVKALKGVSRPVNNEADRAYMLSALSCVDAVVLFDENTPARVIKLIKPDVLVKGGDYKAEDVVGREDSGEVLILPFLKGYSTTGVIEKLQKSEM